MKINDKKAVVVGGASGMARSTAEMLSARGAAVAILDLPTSAGKEAAAALGGSFHPIDVIDDDGVERTLAEAVEQLGGLHIAVNTAGGGIAMRTLTKNGPHPLDDFRRCIAGMVFTMARDLGSRGIRVLAIARSLFSTGLTEGIPDEMAEVLTRDAAFPKRMGRPEEYGRLAVGIVENPMLNGTTIRLDAGQRFAPK